MPENNTEEKWKKDYINYEFFRPKGKEENSYPPAQCMFCLTNYRNANVAPSKLISHFTKQHSEHQNKSKEFLQSHLTAQKNSVICLISKWDSNQLKTRGYYWYHGRCHIT